MELPWNANDTKNFVQTALQLANWAGKFFFFSICLFSKILMLQQTRVLLQQLKTLVNDKGHEKLKSQLPWRDEVPKTAKYDFLNQMINVPSVKFEKKPILLNLKVFLLTDTSVILNWLLRRTNLSTKNCICWISFRNYMISDILQCRIYSTIGTIYPSGVVFKGVLECQIRDSLSTRKKKLVLSQNKKVL